MGMKYQYQIVEDGIKIKKLIGSKMIPFSEIESIVLLEDRIRFTTENGEEVNTVRRTLEDLFNMIVLHNISYRDESDHEEKQYTREELEPLIQKTTELALEVSNEYVKEHLGTEYGVEAKLIEAGGEINLYFVLLRNGGVVKDLPPDAEEWCPEELPGCFDCLALAWLTEWDSGRNSGKYGAVVELTDPERCRNTQLSSMEFEVGVIKGEGE